MQESCNKSLKFITPNKDEYGEIQAVHSDAIELEWKLENFVKNNLGVGEKIEGEPFTVGGCTWRLCLYPDGCDQDHAGIMGIFLRLLSEKRDARASYQMWLVPAGTPTGGSSGRPSTCLTTVGCYPVDVDYENLETVKYRGLPMIRIQELLPPVPDYATHTAQRAGPRSFYNRQGAQQKASWGFPTFLRRIRVARDGYISSRGVVSIRCTIAVHSCVVPAQLLQKPLTLPKSLPGISEVAKRDCKSRCSPRSRHAKSSSLPNLKDSHRPFSRNSLESRSSNRLESRGSVRDREREKTYRRSLVVLPPATRLRTPCPSI